MIDVKSHVTYIKYWENQSRKGQVAIRQVEETNAHALILDIKQKKENAGSIGEFLKVVTQRNNPPTKGAGNYIIKKIRERKQEADSEGYVY